MIKQTQRVTDAYTTAELREHFRTLEGDGVYRPALRKFEAWLAQHDAEVEVKALRGAALRARMGVYDSANVNGVTITATNIEALADWIEKGKP